MFFSRINQYEQRTYWNKIFFLDVQLSVVFRYVSKIIRDRNNGLLNAFPTVNCRLSLIFEKSKLNLLAPLLKNASYLECC
uniref:Uncharacterized protein n=1 Tax=Octopus bimaculoides TaxID=37653 RepID=A0A0L8HYX9_OCTBM